jgi:hypothetical protein
MEDREEFEDYQSVMGRGVVRISVCAKLVYV